LAVAFCRLDGSKNLVISSISDSIAGMAMNMTGSCNPLEQALSHADAWSWTGPSCSRHQYWPGQGYALPARQRRPLDSCIGWKDLDRPHGRFDAWIGYRLLISDFTSHWQR
jgi:hypothetical protein